MRWTCVLAALASAAAMAATPQRAEPPFPAVPPHLKPQVPVYGSGQWVVMRRGAGCAGLHKVNRGARLGADRLLLRSPVELSSVALGFDAESLRPPRPLSDAEQTAGGVILAGEDFAQLQRSRKLRIEAVTVQGSGGTELALDGLPEVLKFIASGCTERKGSR